MDQPLARIGRKLQLAIALCAIMLNTLMFYNVKYINNKIVAIIPVAVLRVAKYGTKKLIPTSLYVLMARFVCFMAISLMGGLRS